VSTPWGDQDPLAADFGTGELADEAERRPDDYRDAESFDTVLRTPTATPA
jgi:hypothetical protein